MDETDSLDELDAWKALRRAKAAALILFLAVTILFIVMRALPPGFWTSLIAAGAEAAMVGALADWFAVVALFRHPLGIPIPHTAIIPRNKDRIGEGLGNFVERHFLHPETLIERIERIDLAARLGQWLRRRHSAETVGRWVIELLRYALETMDDREIRAFLHHALSDQLHKINLAPALGQILGAITEARHHHLLFDRALALAARALDANEARIYEKVAEKSTWYIPSAVDRNIAEGIIEGVRELLTELRDPEHEARQRFERAVDELVDGLKNSPEYAEKVRSFSAALLADEKVQQYLSSIWEQLRNMLINSARPSQDSKLFVAVVAATRSLGSALTGDDAMRHRLNENLKRFVLRFVVPWGREVSRFIADVVRKWDARTVARRVELAVGRDLQFIRINGTVVGGLVGCVIFLVSRLVENLFAP